MQLYMQPLPCPLELNVAVPPYTLKCWRVLRVRSGDSKRRERYVCWHRCEDSPLPFNLVRPPTGYCVNVIVCGVLGSGAPGVAGSKPRQRRDRARQRGGVESRRSGVEGKLPSSFTCRSLAPCLIYSPCPPLPPFPPCPAPPPPSITVLLSSLRARRSSGFCPDTIAYDFLRHVGNWGAKVKTEQRVLASSHVCCAHTRCPTWMKRFSHTWPRGRRQQLSMQQPD